MLVVTNVFRSFTSIISALESYRSDTLSLLFSIFYSPSLRSQWRPRPGALLDYRTLLLSPSVLSILYLSSPPGNPPNSTVPSACHSRHRQSFILIFSFLFFVCLHLLLPLFLLSFPSLAFFLLSLFLQSHAHLPCEKTAASVSHIKIDAAEKHLKTQLR